jgi:hypothetical protein
VVLGGADVECGGDRWKRDALDEDGCRDHNEHESVDQLGVIDAIGECE